MSREVLVPFEILENCVIHFKIDLQKNPYLALASL